MRVAYSLRSGWVPTNGRAPNAKEDKPIMSQRADSLLNIAHRVTSGLTLALIVWVTSTLNEVEGSVRVLKAFARANAGDHDELVRLRQDHQSLVVRVEKIEDQ